MSDYDFATSYKETDVNLYLAELNFITPTMFDILKLDLDINYKGLKLNGEFEKMHYDGDELIFGAGFGPGSYMTTYPRAVRLYGVCGHGYAQGGTRLRLRKDRCEGAEGKFSI